MAITLEALRCWRGKSVWEVSQALHLDAQTTAALLNGQRHQSLTPELVNRLAHCLDLPFAQVVAAANASYAVNVYYGMNPPREETLEFLWQQAGRYAQDQANFAPEGWQQVVGRERRTTIPAHIRWAFTLLGLIPGATTEQVQLAFRERVKAASDGKGGYTRDMDSLVRARDLLLDFQQLHC